MAKELTKKQEMFCLEYLVDLNATQAAIRAGYSEKTAKEAGYENLTKPHVAERVAELKNKRSNEVKTNAEYVLRRLREIDELDIIDILVDDLSSFRPLREWPKSWRTSINGLDVKTIIEGGDQPVEALVQKIKWPDKTKNLELIGRHVNVKAWDKDAGDQVDTVINKVQIEVVSANQSNGD